MKESLVPQVVFKLLTLEQWEGFQTSGEFSGSADDKRDGFIHLSEEHQLRGTWVKHFGSRSDVVIASILTAKMGDDLRFEVSRGGDRFPHLYRVLTFSEVLSSALGSSLSEVSEEA
jgi:uncharacterized protein (DUF952 family)